MGQARLSTPLDEALLAELRDVMADGFDGLVETFIADGERRIDEIEHATADEALRRSAHGLKGASANLGAVRLSAICAALEALARGGDRDGRAALIDDLHAEFAAAREALRAYAAR